MRYSLLVLLVLLVVASPAFGADGRKELRNELRGLTNQIRSAEREAYKNADIAALRKKVMEAQKALRKATSEIPEIKAVDETLAELRKQMRDVTKERMNLVKKNQEALAEPNKALVEARGAVKGAIGEIPEIKELYSKKGELQKKLKGLAPAKKPRKEGEAKKPGARKRKRAKKAGGDM